MANLARWTRPSMLTLRRDVEDVLEDFDIPRHLRRELDALIGEEMSPRSMWLAMDRLMEDFVSPPTLRRRLARLFESIPAWGANVLRGRSAFEPQVELTEGEKDFSLRVDLPGIREKDIDVRIDDDNVVTVSGERREEATKRERGYEWTERAYGSFSRSVQLPRGVDASKMEADFRNGVLEIRAPKLEAARARQIPIGGREGTREESRIIAPGNGGPRAPETQVNAPR